MSIAQAQRIKELEALVAELCLRVAALEQKSEQRAEKKTLSLPKKEPAQ